MHLISFACLHIITIQLLVVIYSHIDATAYFLSHKTLTFTFIFDYDVASNSILNFASLPMKPKVEVVGSKCYYNLITITF